jgi:hypothetical protein
MANQWLLKLIFKLWRSPLKSILSEPTCFDSFLMILMSQSRQPSNSCECGYKDVDRFSYYNLKHLSPKSIKRVRLADDLSLSLNKRAFWSGHFLVDCRFLARYRHSFYRVISPISAIFSYLTRSLFLAHLSDFAYNQWACVGPVFITRITVMTTPILLPMKKIKSNEAIVASDGGIKRSFRDSSFRCDFCGLYYRSSSE